MGSCQETSCCQQPYPQKFKTPRPPISKASSDSVPNQGKIPAFQEKQLRVSNYHKERTPLNLVSFSLFLCSFKFVKSYKRRLDIYLPFFVPHLHSHPVAHAAPARKEIGKLCQSSGTYQTVRALFLCASSEFCWQVYKPLFNYKQ